MESKTVVRKETRKKIRVDYEGKLSFKERLAKRLKASNTWIKAIVNVFRFVLMLGISFVILQPFITRIAGSFMTPDDVISPTVALIPQNPTLQIYEAIFVENNYMDAFFNTMLLSLVSAVLQTFIACVIGYGLAKFKFKGNGLVMVLVVFTMIVPHQTLSLAMKQHFLDFDFFTILTMNYEGPIELMFGAPISMLDTYTPLVILSITGLAFKNGLYIYLMRQFFKGVPDELEESAYVDGSGVFRTFFQIIIPLSVPMMITIFLFSFSWQWTDEFYTGMFFTESTELMSTSVMQITNILKDSYLGDTNKELLYPNVIKNTAGMMVIAPLIVLYLFCQRYLVQGIERSGLVG